MHADVTAPEQTLPDGGPALGRFAPWLDLGLILAGLGLLSLHPSRPTAIDATIRYEGVMNLLDTGRPAIGYPMVGPIFSVPLWYIGELVHHAQGTLMRYNLLLLVLLLGGTWIILKDRVDRAFLRLFLLILVAASMLGWHTQDFLGEMFTAVLVGLGTLLVVMGKGRSGWAALIVGTANTAVSGLGLALLCLRYATTRRRLRYLLAPAAAGLIMIADAWFRNDISSRYLVIDKGVRTVLPFSGLPGFSYPFLLGLMSVLFSFGKGLVFFAPGLLLPAHAVLRRIDPALAEARILWLLFVAGMVLVYSSWWAWYGGLSWGPRFFPVASLPASLALAARLRHPPSHPLGLLGLLAVVLLSGWVGVNGIVFGTPPGACVAHDFANEHLCWYVPEFGTLWRPLVLPWGHLEPYQWAFLVYAAVVFVRLAAELARPGRGVVRILVADGRGLVKGWAI